MNSRALAGTLDKARKKKLDKARLAVLYQLTSDYQKTSGCWKSQGEIGSSGI